MDSGTDTGIVFAAAMLDRERGKQKHLCMAIDSATRPAHGAPLGARTEHLNSLLVQCGIAEASYCEYMSYPEIENIYVRIWPKSYPNIRPGTVRSGGIQTLERPGKSAI